MGKTATLVIQCQPQHGILAQALAVRLAGHVVGQVGPGKTVHVAVPAEEPLTLDLLSDPLLGPTLISSPLQLALSAGETRYFTCQAKCYPGRLLGSYGGVTLLAAFLWVYLVHPELVPWLPQNLLVASLCTLAMLIVGTLMVMQALRTDQGALFELMLQPTDAPAAPCCAGAENHRAVQH